MSRFISEFVTKASALAAAKTSFVSVTLVHPEGHVPQDCGAKAIITEEGLHCGTVGGGRLEARAIEHALTLILKAKKNSFAPDAQLVRYDLKQEFGMVCGGVASLFYEVYYDAPWSIVVFGAGHVAQATVPVLANIAHEVTCIDHRKEWLDRLPAHHKIKKVLTSEPSSILNSISDKAYFVVMTQGHATDLPIVKDILSTRIPPYLGVIGSVPKSRTLKAALLELGIAENVVSSIHCPIGLPIGTNEPQEIAISIAAEILQVRDQLKKPASNQSQRGE